MPTTPFVDFRDVIRRAREGRATPEDMKRVAAAAAGASVPDYQLAAWLMAVAINGLHPPATYALTQAMAESGGSPAIHPGQVDKHSTGGVGDKTTLVVAPLVSCLGVKVAKMSGRGLGHTGGTLDKLESIPGFRVDLSREEIRRIVERVGVVVAAQTEDLAPADGRLYALRDVTETVDSLPLIASSIMSKKIAGGSPAILLDVKVGRGAFMTGLESARELAALMLDIARRAGRRAEALLTDMDQPLGYAVGNALEVNEARDTLLGRGPGDFTALVLAVAARMLTLAGFSGHPEDAAEEALRSGAAFGRFLEWIDAQGGNRALLEEGPLEVAPLRKTVRAAVAGVVTSVDPLAVGRTALRLGAGRLQKADPVDSGVGVRVLVKVGETVGADDVLAEIYARSDAAATQAEHALRSAIQLGGTASVRPTILDHLIA